MRVNCIMGADNLADRNNEFLFDFFNELSKNTVDALLAVDTKGQIQYVNHTFCDITGYSQEELLSMAVSDIEITFDEKKTAERFKNIKSGGRARFISRYRHKDGRVFEVELQVSRFVFENKELFISLVCEPEEPKRLPNISDAKKVLKELSIKTHTRSEYLSKLITYIKDLTGCECVGIRVLEAEGSIKYASYTGFSKEFWRSENWLSLNRDKCICPRVISGRPNDYDRMNMTSGGSFYSNNFFEFVDDIPQKYNQDYRGACAKAGYNSVAILPVRCFDNIVGTIHLADKSSGKVPLKLVNFIEKISYLIGESIYRFNMEEELRRNYDILNVINSMLKISLENSSFEEILSHALDEIFSISWLGFKSWGSVFLVDESSGDLVLAAQKKIIEAKKHICERIPTGKCLCGKAAVTQEIQFADHIDDRHEFKYYGMKAHGHYCVPIVYSGKTLGVINIYISEGYRSQRKDEELLKTIADKLAGIIIRKKAEDALKKSEQRLSLIHNSVSDLIRLMKVNPDGSFRCVAINKSYLERTGVDEERVIGKKIEDNLPEPGASFLIEKCREAIERAKPIKYEENLHFLKGHLVVETTLTPIFDETGKCTHLLSTSHDITAGKQAEEALRQSEERYRSLIKQSSDGVFIMEPQTKKIQEVNDKFISMFGYSEEDISNLTLYDLITAETGEVDELIQRILDEEQLIIQQTRFKCKIGSLKDVEISASLITYSSSSVVVVNVRDITERKRTEEQLKRNFKQLRNTLRETVNAITKTVEKRDPYTVGHQERVAQLACAIAREMGCREYIIEGIKIAGKLHDIGKISVPIEILNKPGKLSKLEMNLIKTHSQVGYEILQKVPFECPVAQIVLQHQERYNGSGYPLGLSGKDILIEARILAVADVVEAMSSHRPYRPAIGIQKALEEISQNRGILYDPEVVDVCLKLFNEEGFRFE